MQQFKSMTELVEYLGGLENRVSQLEAENANLRAIQVKSESLDGNAIAKSVLRALPQTNILSYGFFKRAFAIWGHFFVANLIISIVVGIAYTCFVMVLFGSVFGDVLRQANP